jgi:hypothetical protein
MTREQACFQLAAARYGSEAPALLDLAEKFPGHWHYTVDRHRAVVMFMPGRAFTVQDTEESEERIKAMRREWRSS